MLFILLLDTGLTSSIITLVVLLISQLVTFAVVNSDSHKYTVSFSTLFKRSLLTALAINFFVCFVLASSNIKFNGIHAYSSTLPLILCSLVVVMTVYIYYQTLKVPYEE